MARSKTKNASGKKKAAGAKPAPGSARAQAAKGTSAVSNPFEAQPNRRPKMAVLNRRVKGSDRNVAGARADALARRSKAFATDAERLIKPASKFNDRRLGEVILDVISRVHISFVSCLLPLMHP